jgi:dGTPase
VLELADDIAYATHDLEDGVALGFIKRDDWRKLFDVHSARTSKEKENVALALSAWASWTSHADRLAPPMETLTDWLFSTGPFRRKVVSHLIGAFIHNVLLYQENFECELLRFRATLPNEFAALLQRLKDITVEKVVKSAELQTLEYRGRIMIMEMFDAILSNPELLLRACYALTVCVLYTNGLCLDHLADAPTPAMSPMPNGSSWLPT